MKEKAEIVTAMGLANDEALRRGLVRIPDEDVERVMAMSTEERLAWLSEQYVRTERPDGTTKVQPVGSLMKRGLEARAARNRRKRERRARKDR